MNGARFEAMGKIISKKDYTTKSGYFMQFVTIQVKRPYTTKDKEDIFDKFEVTFRDTCPFAEGKFIEVRGRVESTEGSKGGSFPSFVVDEYGEALRPVKRPVGTKSQAKPQEKPQTPPPAPPRQDEPPADIYDEWVPF